MISWIHPALFFFIGAALLPFVKGKGKPALLIGAPLLAFLSLLIVQEGNYGVFSVAGQELIFGRVDRLGLLFSYVFTLMAAIGMVYAMHVQRDGEHTAALLYAGSALGAVFAGDLLTLFLFWESMAFSSVLLIWYGEKQVAAGGKVLLNPKAPRAGFRYLMVHLFGGAVLLGGIVIHALEAKSIAFGPIPPSGWGGALILLGFLVNAAAVPLHAWLPDGYPEATVTGTVFLSAFTTKTAVYVLARGFAGTELLIYLGVIMTLYGVGYAMLENNIRRLLSYHIVSQVGFMVTGVGIGTELAINGAAAHAYAHIVYKALLMMGMGSVIFMTGKRKGSELGGLASQMPKTAILFMIGGFSISGVPLLSGFISKSMVISAAGEAHRPAVYLLLILASCGTFLSTTLKLPYAVFMGEGRGMKTSDPPKNMQLGMALAAGLCLLLGIWPGLLYRLLPHAVEYHPYTAEHLAGSFQILLFTLLGFLIFLPKLHPKEALSVDFDWFYRKTAPAFRWLLQVPLTRYEQIVTEAYRTILIRPVLKLAEWGWFFDVWVVDGLVNASGWVTLLESKISEIFDVYVVDGTVNGVSATLDAGARRLRRLQTGAIQNYVLAMVMGIVVLAVVFMF